MQEPFFALQEIVLPALESGNYAIVSDFSSTSESDSKNYIEAYSYDKESHTHYEWMWLLSGEAHMKIAGQVHKLLPGDFCFLPPLVPHADVYDRDTPAYTSLWFSHLGSNLTTLVFSYQPWGQQEVGRIEGIYATEEMGRVLVDLQREISSDEPYSQTLARALLLQLAAILARSIELKQQEASRSMMLGPISNKVITYLRENYKRDLSLSEIADNTFLTPNYLSTVFKQETNLTIWEALARIRVEYATRLLMENKIPLHMVAQSVGYNSLDRFTRVFRRIKGVAPKYYGKESPHEENPNLRRRI